MKTVAAIIIASAACASAFLQNPASMGLAATSSASKMTMAAEPTRREFLQVSGATAAAAAVGFAATVGSAQPALADGPYTLPPLPYAYEALEPYIDAATMKFHHDKHHAAYVATVNKAMAGKEAPSITDLQKGAFKAGGPTRNAGGGHYNHALFWKTMGPAKESGSPSPALAKAIDEAFGSMDEMKAKFNAAATGQFGSGWSWLGVQADGKLAVVGTPNQDNPLMEGATATPMNVILGCDVWEHAYYLKYQNRRPEYVENWWNVVNWGYVSEIYDKYASKGMPVPVEG